VTRAREVAQGQPAPSDPIALPVNPIEVSIQGKKARVGFAGLAPGFAGVFQINVYVPDGVTADPAAPLVISAGRTAQSGGDARAHTVISQYGIGRRKLPITRHIRTDLAPAGPFPPAQPGRRHCFLLLAKKPPAGRESCRRT